MQKSILVIDDNELLLDTVQELLRLNGYDVTRCDRGAKVIDVLSKKPFDAALVDYQIPDMTGVKITRILRKEYPRMLIVGFSLFHRRNEFMEAGADYFYPKPFIDEVMQKISELV